MAASIIDVVASGHINRSVILDVTERLAIQTPALLGGAGDSRGRRVARRQPAAASRGPRLRAGPGLREDVACSWRSCCATRTATRPCRSGSAAYLSRLTPVSLPRHFQVVIDAATGKGARRRRGTAAGEPGGRVVRARRYDREDIFDAAVSEWKRRLLSLGARYGENPDFSLLAGQREGMEGAVSAVRGQPGHRAGRPGTSVSASRRARTCRMTSGGISASCSGSWHGPRTPRRRSSSAR